MRLFIHHLFTNPSHLLAHHASDIYQLHQTPKHHAKNRTYCSPCSPHPSASFTGAQANSCQPLFRQDRTESPTSRPSLDTKHAATRPGRCWNRETTNRRKSRWHRAATTCPPPWFDGNASHHLLLLAISGTTHAGEEGGHVKRDPSTRGANCLMVWTDLRIGQGYEE